MYPVTLQQFKTSNPEKIVTSHLVKKYTYNFAKHFVYPIN